MKKKASLELLYPAVLFTFVAFACFAFNTIKGQDDKQLMGCAALCALFTAMCMLCVTNTKSEQEIEREYARFAILLRMSLMDDLNAQKGQGGKAERGTQTQLDDASVEDAKESLRQGKA